MNTIDFKGDIKLFRLGYMSPVYGAEHKRVYRCILSLQYKYTISLSTNESKHKIKMKTLKDRRQREK